MPSDVSEVSDTLTVFDTESHNNGVSRKTNRRGRTSGGKEVAPRPVIGRPPHQPTDKQRQEVQAYASAFIPHEDIAALIGIAHNTLLKHYRDDLALGRARGRRRGATAYVDLLDKRSEKVVLHFAKTELGMREVTENKVHLTNSGPLTIEHYMKMPMEDLRKRIIEIDHILDEAAEEDGEG